MSAEYAATQAAKAESDKIAAAFFARIPDQHKPYVDRTRTLWALIPTAVQSQGWPVDALVDYCTRGLDKVSNKGAVVTSRVRHCVTIRYVPPAATLPAKFTQPLPWCGDCSDAAARWIEDPGTGRPLGRCPKCWTSPT